eukprot:g24863.t1
MLSLLFMRFIYLDNSLATKTGGCFPSKAMVTLENGKTRAVSELNPGDRVLTVNAAGQVVPSQVLLFLDKEEQLRISFTVLETEDSRQRLELTAAHLIFVSDNNTDRMENFRPIFASRVRTVLHPRHCNATQENGIHWYSKFLYNL